MVEVMEETCKYLKFNLLMLTLFCNRAGKVQFVGNV
jgi:hypothetical protein